MVFPILINLREIFEGSVHAADAGLKPAITFLSLSLFVLTAQLEQYGLGLHRPLSPSWVSGPRNALFGAFLSP